MKLLSVKVPVLTALFTTYVTSLALDSTNTAKSAPSVTIDSGVVIGKLTAVPSGTASPRTAVNYLGIPFAAVPTGARRFAPPEAPACWKSPLQATSFPPACRQQFVNNATKAIFNNPGYPPPMESEDCLYLNIYAPVSASPKELKPVMFWIYGGDLDFGSIVVHSYNGSSFAAFQDVIVVAANYRTNIFGFLGSSELPDAEQNAGFLDQRYALQWVQKNIRHFGGDPNKVTIFGESAGGYSVKQILAQPPEPLPFRAAILESQAATTGNTTTSYNEVVAHFGCAKAKSPLECLRGVNGVELEKYITASNIFFYPIQNNITSTGDVRPSISSKRFADVPILIGTNADEGRVFFAAAGLDSPKTTEEEVQGFLDYEFDNATELVTAALALYADSAPTPYERGSLIFTDFIFTCTTQSLSNYAALNGYNNIWRYYYNATFRDEAFYPNLGAYHSSEIPQVFGTYDLSDALGKATPAQEGLSKYMQTTWANFAKRPDQGPNWPKITYLDISTKLGELGGPVNPKGENTINTSVVDGKCSFWDPVISLLGY